MTVSRFVSPRRWLQFWALIVLGIVTFGTMGAQGTITVQATGDVGYRDFSFGTSVSSPTAEKPQSKLWFNDGLWWGSLYNASAGEYRIYRLNWDTQTWSDTGTRIDMSPINWSSRNVRIL